MYSTLISTSALANRLGDYDLAILDCRFDLSDPDKGRKAYRHQHIPGAIYAHLDTDLSGPIIPGRTGRHPLPTVAAFSETVSRWGIDDGVQVVVYDDANGFYAGRLWWMLRWLGHDAVALLDGGLKRWLAEDLPVRAGLESRARRAFVPHVHMDWVVDADEILANLEDDTFVLADARDAARYAGESGALDPIGGHIPGAVSAHLGKNLNEDGTFRSPAELRHYYVDLFGDPDTGMVPEDIVFYCGSGVTAAHDLLAMQVAGLGEHRLYPGSWSDWILDPDRPIATGSDA